MMLPQPLLQPLMQVLPTLVSAPVVLESPELDTADTLLPTDACLRDIDRYFRPLTIEQPLCAELLPQLCRQVAQTFTPKQHDVVMRVVQRLFWMGAQEASPSSTHQPVKVSYDNLLAVLQHKGALIPFIDLVRQGNGDASVDWTHPPDLFIISGSHRRDRQYLQGLQIKKQSEIDEDKVFGKRQFCLQMKWDKKDGCYKLVRAQGPSSQDLITAYVKTYAGTSLDSRLEQVIFLRELGVSDSVMKQRPEASELQEKLKQPTAFLETLWQIKRALKADLPTHPRKIYLSGRIVVDPKTGIRTIYQLSISHKKRDDHNANFYLGFIWNETHQTYDLDTVKRIMAKTLVPVMPANMSPRYLSGNDRFQNLLDQLAKGSRGVLSLWRAQNRKAGHIYPDIPAEIYVRGTLKKSTALYYFQMSVEKGAGKQSQADFELKFSWDENTGCYKITEAHGYHAYKLALQYTSGLIGRFIVDPLEQLILKSYWKFRGQEPENLPIPHLENAFRQNKEILALSWKFMREVCVNLPEHPEKIYVGIAFQKDGAHVNHFMLHHEQTGIADALAMKYGCWMSFARNQETQEYFVTAVGNSGVLQFAFASVLSQYPESEKYQLDQFEKLALMCFWQTNPESSFHGDTLSLTDLVRFLQKGNLGMARVMRCLSYAGAFDHALPEKVYLTSYLQTETDGTKGKIANFGIIDESGLAGLKRNVKVILSFTQRQNNFELSSLAESGIMRELGLIYVQAVRKLNLRSLYPTTALTLLRSACQDPVIFFQLLKSMLVDAGKMREDALLPDRFILAGNIVKQSGSEMVEDLQVCLSRQELSSSHNMRIYFEKKGGRHCIMHVDGIAAIQLAYKIYQSQYGLTDLDVLQRAFLGRLWLWQIKGDYSPLPFDAQELNVFLEKALVNSAVQSLIQIQRSLRPAGKSPLPKTVSIVFRVLGQQGDSSQPMLAFSDLIEETQPPLAMDTRGKFILHFTSEEGVYQYSRLQGNIR